MTLKNVLRGAAVIAGLAPVGAFAADRVGVLECHLSGNAPSIVVESQTVDCVFKSDSEGVAPSHYVGKLTKVGANLSVNGGGQLMWIVTAASSQVGPGALVGHYVGPSASVRVGVGGGGAILVGGSDNTVSLQPFQVEAGTGLGVTAGVSTLELAYVDDAARKTRRHHHHHH